MVGFGRAKTTTDDASLPRRVFLCRLGRSKHGERVSGLVFVDLMRQRGC